VIDRAASAITVDASVDTSARLRNQGRLGALRYSLSPTAIVAIGNIVWQSDPILLRLST